MRKRVLSLLLAACMTFSVLPATAYAAVGELLGNSPAQNQMLLEQLSALTGGDAQAVYDVLEQYGLLDENGQLKTDQTVDLNGKTYTLEEMETLLGDPGTDLGQIGYVDGVPIALGDLKTIIAIEREMARIQETYFSGKAFEGESLTNLNALMAQLQNDGISVNAAAVAGTVVMDVSNFTSVDVDSAISKSGDTSPLPEGTVLSVDVHLDAELAAGLESVGVALADQTARLTRENPTATLTYVAEADERASVLIMPYSDTSVPDYAYGQLAGAVQFSNAKGFVFQNGNDYSDSHTVRVTKDVDVPDLSTQWEDDSWNRANLPNGWVVDSKFEFEVLDSADRSSNPALGITNSSSGATPATVNEFIGLLQGAKGFTNADDVSDSDFVAFTITGNLEQLSKENYSARIVAPGNTNIIPSTTYERNMYFLPDPEYNSEQTADRVVQDPTYGMILTLIRSGKQLGFALSATTKLGTNAIPDQVLVKEPFKQTEGFTDWEHWIQLNNCVVELTNDGTVPELTAATAPDATYRPGQLVPVVLAFDELVYVKDDAIALKIGLFGELDVDSQNRFLSRTYLSDSSKQQLNGQALSIQSEVGIKFVAEFLLISYEAVLASGKFGATQSFNDWKTIDDYWNSANTGLSAQSLQATATQSGLRVAASSATLQDRDYLENYARTWGNPLRSFALFSLDDPSGVEYLQNNANPASYPELSDDGQLLVYISDSDSQSIYDSRAHFSTLSGSSYAPSTEIAHPADFEGYGDSDVDVAGTQSFAAAAWVRVNTDLPGKDANDPVTAVDQNLLMNGTEIVASIYNGSGWTSTRLTENATPDLAPAVASDGTGRAVVFWRSVYSAGPEEDLMDFAARDQIMYSVYDGSKWSEAKMLYNGSSGSVKALQAAMLPDGTAMAVYTLDRSWTGNTSDYEIGYTILNENGTPGASMIATSDTWLDENPQVIAADFGGGDNRFVIGWHSLRNEIGDIQLLAVDGTGAMSNTFPASLSALTSTGEASVSGDFRFATLSGGYGVDDLTVIWSEQISDGTNKDGLTAAAHSVLKAARLLRDNSGYHLSAPLELAELPANNLVNHFSAYISGDDQVKAVIQATYYDNENTETINGVVVPGEKAMLYTATSDFTQYGVEVENIGVDYENLMTNSLTPIQFTIRNIGIKDLSGLTVTMADGETAELETTLKPNESAVLTVYHKVGDAVADQTYTISGDQLSSITGTAYLDYPDIGIARMEVLKEEAGKRTISMTLYNASGATMAGSKEREVKLAFYSDNLLTQPANVTCASDGVAADKNILTISGEDALKRIDEGSFTLELTYDVGSYVTTVLEQKEIPSSGVYLYADVWAEGKVGEQSTAQRLPEYRSGDNQSAVSLSGAYARTGDKTTLDVVQTNTDVTTATITLRNNCLQALDTGTLEATLLDASGQPLETKTTSISGNLPGETAQVSPITFSQLGSRVVVHTMTGEDSLYFDGLPVSMDDFVLGEDGTLTYALSEVSEFGTFVTAVSGSGEKVSINGKEFTGSGNLYVPIGVGETVITVTIGTQTYSLHITSTHAGTSRYKITVESASGGKVETGQSTARAGTTVTLATKPDEGYRLGTLTVTDKNGKTIALNDKGDGKYTFTMPSSNVTVKASFVEITAGDLPFVDIPSGIWYEDGVRYVYEHGLMNGTSATTFSPEMITTRSMIATILWRMEGSPVVDDAVAFDDVDLDSWYGEAVRWAAKEGIITGYGNNKFGPDDPITREQMATMLYRYAVYKGYDVSVGEDVNLLSYTDIAELGEYAVSAMQWAVADGIINGTSSSTLSPRGNATRSQVAVILMRYCEKAAE